MAEQQLPGSLEEAIEELARVEGQIQQGGRVFFGIIFSAIGTLAFVAGLMDGNGDFAVFGGGLGVLGVLFGLGILPSSLPHRWGGEAVHERAAFLRGYIDAKEQEQGHRDG